MYISLSKGVWINEGSKVYANLVLAYCFRHTKCISRIHFIQSLGRTMQVYTVCEMCNVDGFGSTVVDVIVDRSAGFGIPEMPLQLAMYTLVCLIT